jgi:hypothetical protein
VTLYGLLEVYFISVFERVEEYGNLTSSSHLPALNVIIGVIDILGAGISVA